MNFVGHIAAGLRARASSDDPAFLVGTALPDFAAMGRTRLGPAEGALGGGIALHHATDQVFHSERWFLELEAELRSCLLDDGLPDGAARACAHVGPELLLDGALLDDPTIARGVTTVYRNIASPDDDVVRLAPADERDRWRTHLEGVATRLDPFSYRDAVIVARRLHAITSRRPRLAFDDSLVDTVAVRMTAVQPRVASSSTQVLDRVAGAVAGTHPRRRWRVRR
ncbi:MAG: hypothetical protein WD271_05365 [Acidimicrobiia bacterium]